MLAAIGETAEVGYLTEPTPGVRNASNDRVFQGFVTDTKFSVRRGFFDRPFQAEISSDHTRRRDPLHN